MITCSVNVSVEQNSTITWANSYTQMTLINEKQKYTINATKLIIHNITLEDEGEYICYSEELAIAYTVMDIIVICKYFLIATLCQYNLF